MGGIGAYRQRVSVEGPEVPVPDGDGGYTEGWGPLDPADWDCAIAQASARDLERIGAGTVLSQATHLVKGNYHAGLTTKARLRFIDKGVTRTLNIVHVVNRDERDEESHVLCAEVVE
jgi:head-tail adaptor